MNKRFFFYALLAAAVLFIGTWWMSMPKETAVVGGEKPVSQPQCNEELWNRVYHGRFKTAQERLKVLSPCVALTGTIVNARKEADGDWHLQFAWDAGQKDYTNLYNQKGQNGYLVLEPICENKVSQRDTIREGVCQNYKGTIFDHSLLGKHVKVTGPLVVDMEHRWTEVHPVTSIQVIP